MTCIIHGSDWHGSPRKLPRADLYVLTGDMLPNFGTFWMEDQRDGETRMWRPHDGKVLGHFEYEGAIRPPGYMVRREFNNDHEQHLQALWIEKNVAEWSDIFGNPDAPVVLVRGNHDFVDLTDLFMLHGGELVEFSEPTDGAMMIAGLTVRGFRGIPYICGEWSDELRDYEMQARVDALPDDFDLLITHTPPHGILDGMDDGIDFGTGKERILHIGAQSLTSKLQKLMMQGKKFIHCFGHNHDDGGQVQVRGECTFSNAATTTTTIGEPYSIIDLEVKK